MTTTFPPHALLAQERWRYAVKRFDTTRKIAASDWDALEQALVLSPSSYGLQPYVFIVVDDPAVRARLTPAVGGQPQVEDCSHFVVCCIRRDVDRAYVDGFIARMVEVRGVTPESLGGYRQTIIDDLIDGPRNAWIDHWSARQTYLALGNLLISAAVMGIDACPMEGFDPERVDTILDLRQAGLHSVVCCALGYRSAEDTYAKAPKVRYPLETLIQHR